MRDSNSIKIHFSHPDGWGEDKTVDEIRTEYGMTLNEYANFISLESPKTARKMRENDARRWLTVSPHLYSYLVCYQRKRPRNTLRFSRQSKRSLR